MTAISGMNSINNLMYMVAVASFATVGLIEVVKNFFRTERKWVYALVMVPLAVLCFWMQAVLPSWAIGAVLTVGATQLCYQTIVQTFQSLIRRLADGGKLSDLGAAYDEGDCFGSLKGFVRKYDGVKVDFDGHYGPQCVDLFRQYCREVLGFPHTGGVEGAKDLWLRYSELREKDFFVQMNADSIPIPGDVAVWGQTAANRYGHVAIVIGELEGDLIVFEQDGFKQDGAKIKVRGKENLLGYLRVLRPF